jgi:DNA polymerase-3 subunit epsilon
MSWSKGPFLAYDSESTAPDPHIARLVTATTAYRSESDSGWTRQWLADAGRETIPAEAVAIHNVTTERAHRYGRPVAEVAREVRDQLYDAWAAGVPVVVFNAPYDTTLVSHELVRAGEPELEIRGAVLDPLCLDRHLSRRRGSRQLADQCAHYGVRHTSAAPGESGGAGAHDATADALAAVRVLWRQAQRHPELAALNLGELQDRQREWHAADAERYAVWRRTKGGDPGFVAEIGWPVRPVSFPAAVLV